MRGKTITPLILTMLVSLTKATPKQTDVSPNKWQLDSFQLSGTNKDFNCRLQKLQPHTIYSIIKGVKGKYMLTFKVSSIP